MQANLCSASLLCFVMFVCSCRENCKYGHGALLPETRKTSSLRFPLRKSLKIDKVSCAKRQHYLRVRGIKSMGCEIGTHFPCNRYIGWRHPYRKGLFIGSLFNSLTSGFTSGNPLQLFKLSKKMEQRYCTMIINSSWGYDLPLSDMFWIVFLLVQLNPH